MRKTLRVFSRGRFFLSKLQVNPVSRIFGVNRGMPIDRYYIESFLKNNSPLISGDVLEISESTYTRKFGRNISQAMVLDCCNENANFIGDLATGDGIPESVADCFIMTQTLPFIYDFKAVVKNAFRTLKDNGILLITVGGITQISRYDMDRWGHYWSFTDLSLRKLLEEVFDPCEIDVRTYGNVKTASAFLYGLAAEEFKQKDLDYHDRDYQVTICAKAKKTL